MTEAGGGSGCPALRWAGLGAGFRPPPPRPLRGRWGDHQTLLKKWVPNFKMMMIDGDGDAGSPPRASCHGYAKARQAKTKKKCFDELDFEKKIAKSLFEKKF